MFYNIAKEWDIKCKEDLVGNSSTLAINGSGYLYKLGLSIS